MLRRRALERILQLDPVKDHLEIVFLDNCCEFPFDITRGVEFALFRTFAVPSISRLLDQTGEFQYRAQKRNDNTELILSEIVDHGYDGRVPSTRPPTVHDLQDLVYLEMVLKETLRLYPAIWLSMRLAAGPFSFGGYDFDAGTFVGLSRYVSHRMPEIFADPEQFTTERFDPVHGERHPQFVYIPFGGGPRICPGAARALTEAKVIMSRLLSRYRLKLRPGYRTTPLVRLTLGVRGGLPMRVAAA